MEHFDVIEQAGISQGQFAALVGVSRVTVNTWVRGKFSPRPDLKRRVAAILRLVGAAVQAGRLPVPIVDHRKATEVELQRIRAMLETQE